MSGKRFACLILVVAMAALGCANGRPAPLACAIAGQLGGGRVAGVAAGDTNAERIGYGVAGAVVGSVAGWYLCKLAQKDEPPPPPSRPRRPPPPRRPSPSPRWCRRRSSCAA